MLGLIKCSIIHLFSVTSMQALAEAIHESDRERELLVDAGSAEVGEGGVGRDAEDEAWRAVQIDGAADGAGERRLVIEEADICGWNRIAVLVLKSAVEVSVGSADERVEEHGGVNVAGSAILGAYEEHVFANKGAFDAVRVGCDTTGSVIAAGVAGDCPAWSEEARYLCIKPAEIGSLGEVGTGVEVGIGKAAVNFPAPVVANVGQRAVWRNCGLRILRPGLKLATKEHGKSRDQRKHNLPHFQTNLQSLLPAVSMSCNLPRYMAGAGSVLVLRLAVQAFAPSVHVRGWAFTLPLIGVGLNLLKL